MSPIFREIFGRFVRFQLGDQGVFWDEEYSENDGFIEYIHPRVSIYPGCYDHGCIISARDGPDLEPLPA